MNKKGLVTVEILSIIFVPGMFSLFLITKVAKIFTKFHHKKSSSVAIVK